MNLVDDTLESVLAGSDDEAEEDAVISQVLDEIGIEVSGKVSHRSVCHEFFVWTSVSLSQLSGVGVANKPLSGKDKAADTETDDIEARLR